MPNKSRLKANMVLRQRRVARWRLQRLTVDEISERLAETSTPASRATVARDVQKLELKWRTDSLRDMGTLKGEHVAELREVRRRAWEGTKGDGKPQLFYVLKSLDQEAKVLLLEQPEASESGAAASAFLLGADTMRTLHAEGKATPVELESVEVEADTE